MKYEEIKTKSESYYNSIGSIRCPYFDDKVIFNADGLFHLSHSSLIRRRKSEEIVRFNLFKFAPEIIARSGTIQEYRKTMIAQNAKGARNEKEMKVLQYWDSSQ